MTSQPAQWRRKGICRERESGESKSVLVNSNMTRFSVNTRRAKFIWHSLNYSQMMLRKPSFEEGLGFPKESSRIRSGNSGLELENRQLELKDSPYRRLRP